MRVLHVVGREMKEIPPEEGEYTFLDGDVYVIDNGNDIYIWLGKDCGVEEKTIGAWVSNKLDNEERGGEPTVTSVDQGEEPEELTELIEINVVDGDTPGFLREAELDLVDYSLHRVYIKEETTSFDEAEIEEVPLKRSSLTSDDIFVLDGNEKVYMFVGKNAQREERVEGQKLMQRIDSERNYIPLTYTIYEGEGGKSEKSFYEFLEKAAESGPVVSVEDRRELDYRPEESKSAAEERTAGEKTVESEDMSATKPEKKGFWARILSWFS